MYVYVYVYVYTHTQYIKNLTVQKLLTGSVYIAVACYLWSPRRVQHQVGQLFEQFVEGGLHVAGCEHSPAELAEQS